MSAVRGRGKDGTDMLLWALAASAAFFVKGLCGFANTLVFTSILSFGASNVSISPIEVVLGYPTNVILAWRERRHFQPALCLPVCGLVVAGSIPGILLLKHADVGAIKILFGIVTIFIGAEMLLRQRSRKKRKQSRALLAAIGILSGLLCGMYGIGALLGAYFSRVTEDSHGFKANICVVFLVESTVRICLYWAWGIITPGTLRQALLLAPFMLAGLALGIGCSRLVRESTVQQLVTLTLMASGVALVAQNL